MTDTTELYITETIKSFRGLKSTAEKAIAQVSDEELHFTPDPESNSIAIILQHIAGNMVSRFTDFLTTDGEKPNRNRDAEFVENGLSREILLERWNKGWDILLNTLAELTQGDISKIVFIRQEEHTVLRALHRQLVHYAYHIGQIVYLCKLIRSKDFKTLTMPKKPA